jgi:hypothetical protein
MAFSPEFNPLNARRAGAFLLLVCVCRIASAQSEQSAEPTRLNEITVTGNPLGNAEGIQAVQVLQGDDLRQSSKARWAKHWAICLGSAAVTLDRIPAGR